MPLIILGEEEAFAIGVDLAEDRLELVLRGFWQVSTVSRLADVLRIAQHALGGIGHGRKGYVVLVDNSTFQVQRHDVVDAISRLVADEKPPRRIAVVVTSALLRRQALRVGPDHRFFTTRSDALRWLAGR